VSKWSGLAMAAVGFSCFWFAQSLDHDSRQEHTQANKPLSALMMGSDAVLDDLLWFDLLQYFGGYKLGEHDLAEFPGKCERLLRIAPDFHRAAVFACAIYADDMARPRMAIDLLARMEGLNPDHWIYPYEQGFINYLWLENYQQAESDFRRAGKIPGVPVAWKHFVARIRELGGSPELSREMWLFIAETTEHRSVREAAEANIKRLDALLKNRRLSRSSPEI
jgi:hypothetical protein